MTNRAAPALLGVAALVGGCAPVAHDRHEAPAQALASAPSASPASPPPPARDAEAVARWTPGPDGAVTWTRGAGAHATRLVTRGVIRPTRPDEMATCPDWAGARTGTPPLHLAFVDGPHTLRVWARAGGPIGLRTEAGSCASAGAGEWARLDLDIATPSEVEVQLADVDRAGERRGQTSPYVLVVTEEDTPPTEQPEARALPGPGDVTVRWSLAPATCPQGLEAWHCAKPTLHLAGAVERTVTMKQLLLGQSGCWPDDTGVTCAGASGASFVSLTVSPDGGVRVDETSESDGYCEPDASDHCRSHTRWTSFALRPGVRLVPDPAGTFPTAD